MSLRSLNLHSHGSFKESGHSSRKLESLRAINKSYDRVYTKPVSQTRIFGLAIAGMIIEWAWAVEDSVIFPLMEENGIDLNIATLVYLPVAIVCIISGPIFGSLSDNSRSPLGKRLPFVLAFGITILVGLVGLFEHQKISDAMNSFVMNSYTSTCFIFFLFFALADIGADLMLTPSRSIMGDILSEEQLEETNGRYGAYLTIGRALALLIGALPCENALSAMHLGDWSHEEALLVVSVLMIAVGMVFFAAAAYRREEVEESLAERDNESDAGELEKDISIWRKFKEIPGEVIMLCLVQLCMWKVILVQNWFWTVYIPSAKTFPGTSIHVAYIGLCGASLMSFVFSLSLPTITKYAGNKLTYFSVCLAGSLSICVLYWPVGDVLATVIASLMGCVFGVMDGTIYVLVEQGTAHISESRRGFIMALISDTLLFAMITVSIISAVVLPYLNNRLPVLFLCVGMFGVVTVILIPIAGHFLIKIPSSEKNIPSTPSSERSIPRSERSIARSELNQRLLLPHEIDISSEAHTGESGDAQRRFQKVDTHAHTHTHNLPPHIPC